MECESAAGVCQDECVYGAVCLVVLAETWVGACDGGGEGEVACGEWRGFGEGLR